MEGDIDMLLFVMVHRVVTPFQAFLKLTIARKRRRLLLQLHIDLRPTPVADVVDRLASAASRSVMNRVGFIAGMR